MADYKALDAKAIKLGKRIIEMCTVAGSGHPSSGLSLLHLTTALMYRIMRYDPKNPWNTGSDRLVLSEGHAVPVIYAAYCDLGGVAGTKENPIELKFDCTLSLREADSVLDGHPNPAVGFPFFDAATGSLGQGLSVAAGLGAAARMDGSDKKIYCMIGDGEAREGQIAEALDFIADHKLTNVYSVFNCNGQGQSDYVSPQQAADTMTKKLEAYNFEVRVIDGHDWDEVFQALETPAADKPVAIIAKTAKGWGSTELQSKNYHGKPLSQDLVAGAFTDFDNLAKKLGVNGDVQADELAIPQPLKAACTCKVSAGSFADAVKAVGWEKDLDKKKLSTRRAYGAALAALGKSDKRVVALDGDVKNSTFADLLAKACPDQYFEGRIAEQNIISAASGLAAGGKIPFVSSFAKFLVRGYDQLEMASNTNANIKLCGSHAGISLAADGPSQMALPDVAFVRSFAHATRADGSPAIQVFCPSDAVSAFKLTELMANTAGLCYMRTHRPDVPLLYGENDTFELGGFKQLVEGKDLLIVASGYMVHLANETLNILKEKHSISAGLIDAYSLPLDTDGILKIAATCGGKILVVEDNYAGGFGDEVAVAAAADAPEITVKSLYVKQVPKSARSPKEIMLMANLSPEEIADAAKAMT
jgi:transketolase